MTKVLTVEEIVNLSQTLQETCFFIERLKLKHPEAKFIQKPKIPCALTESIVYHLISSGLILPVLSGFRVVGRGDLKYEKKGQSMVIQIKGTGAQGFSKLSWKDIFADYLIWVDMKAWVDDFPKCSLGVHVLECPKRYLSKPKHIRINEFLALPRVQSYEFNA